MALPFLEKIGLTAKEADIYEFLLKKGEITAGPIIAELGLKRATVYKSLYSLEQKGLIVKRDVNKKIHFKPEAPTKLLELAEAAHHEQERARDDLRTMIPELNIQYISSVERPIVTTFEGTDGLKQMYEDNLKEGKTIYAVLQTQEVNDELYKWLTTTYVKKRVKLGIHAQVILSSGKWSKEYVEKDTTELRESRMVSSDKFPFAHEVTIYGDKVSFINYKKDEALIGILINHPQIARTMKAWFDLAWVGAEKLTI